MLTLDDITALRNDTPGCAHHLHLNNAGAALMPQPVIQAVQQYLTEESLHGGYETAATHADAIAGFYKTTARLLNTQAHNVAFLASATDAYAKALSAIPFERGDVILTSTDDYVSNQFMFLSLAKRLGVRVIRMPNAPEGGIDVDAVIGAIEAKPPRLVALTHVPTNSGLVQPVEAVGKACRARNVLYLVDACQSVGQLPVDVETLECDFLSATARKFLRGPRGAGFLFVSDRILERGYAPLFIDLQGATWRSADEYVPRDTAARFENWEFAYALILGLGVAARYGLQIGVERIAARSGALAATLRAQLSDAGLRVLDRGPALSATVTVQIPGWEPDAFHRELEQRGINTSVSTRAYAVIDFEAKGVEWALRLSPHYYNTEQEIETAAETVATLAHRPPVIGGQ